MRNTILALAITVMFAACTTSLDQPEPPSTAKLSLVEMCGRPPQLPPLQYTGGSPVVVNEYIWIDHVTWVQDVFEWANCATKQSGEINSQKVLQACRNHPDTPEWKVSFDSSNNAYIDHTMWMDHMVWVNSMEEWTICADGTNPRS